MTTKVFVHRLQGLERHLCVCDKECLCIRSYPHLEGSAAVLLRKRQACRAQVPLNRRTQRRSTHGTGAVAAPARHCN